MKPALARIQRLCCLGIGGEVLMPDLVQEVRGLIPCRHAVFYWLDAKFQITNTYSTFSPAVMRLFFEEFLLTDRQTSVIRTLTKFKRWPASTPPVRQLQQILLVDYATFLRSEFYNLLWRAAEIHETLSLCVRSADRIHGLLEICRGIDEPPFGPNDVRVLEAIAGFVAHGMMRVTLDDDAFADSEDRALLVTDADGRVLHADGAARGLLAMALNPRLSPDIRWRGLAEPIPELARLCRMLKGTAGGEIGQPPPAQRLRNPWGEFALRAYWLGATDGAEPTRRIGITIARRVPRALALRRRVETLPLTAREKQLCLLLARGQSGQALADGMGLAASTVITHQRSIYAKLGVHSRAGLFKALEPA